MGEFIMPAVFGLSGQQPSVPQDILSTEGSGTSFGDVLSMVMGSTDITEVPVVFRDTQAVTGDIPEMPDFEGILTDALEAVKAMAAEGENAEISLPEEFSPKGKEAFVTSLCRFLGKEKGDGAKAEKSETVTADDADMQEADILPEDIRKIWQNVPESEKSLWAELFERIANITEESDEEGTKLTAALVKLCEFKGAKKSKSGETDENTAVSAAAMAMFIPAASVSMVSVENAVSENVGAEDTAVTAVSEAGGNTEDIQNVEIQEIIQIVSDSDISSDKLADFFKQAAAELNVHETADIEVTDGQKNADTVTDSAIPSDMFAVGRQSVMSRASKPLETVEYESKAYTADNVPDENVSAAAVNVSQTTATNEPAFVPSSEEIIPEYDIAEQIVSKIGLYKELEELTIGSRKELTIKLAPEELGELEVKIRSTKDGLEIAFAAERSEAARLIGDKASALAEAVAAGGSRLREMTVTQQIVTHETGDTLSYGQYGGEANASGGRDFGESGRRFVFSGSEPDSTESDGGQDPQIFYNKEAKLWVSA